MVENKPKDIPKKENSEDILIKSVKEIKFNKMLKENYKDFFSKSGLVRFVFCLILSILFTALIYLVYLTGDYFDLLFSIITTLIGGYLGLIAFALSAVAIVTAMITNKFLVHIVQKSTSEEKGLINLRGLFFPFYFSAVLDFIVLILLILNLLLLYIDSNFTFYVLMIMSLVTSFLCSYSIVYSVELIGLSIRIRFLAVKY